MDSLTVDKINSYLAKMHNLFYLLSELAILLVRSITPLCFFTLLFLFINYPIYETMLMPDYTLKDYIIISLFLYALAEVCFYIYCRLLYVKLFKDTDPKVNTLNRQERSILYNKITASINDPRHLLTRWYLKKHKINQKESIMKILDNFNELTKSNVLDWFSWAFFHKKKELLSMEELEELNIMIDSLDIGFSFDPSNKGNTIQTSNINNNTNTSNPSIPENLHNYDVNCMRLTIDPVNVCHRPFLLYLIVFLVNFIGYLLLTMIGFRRYQIKKYSSSYWVYNPKQSKPNQAKSTKTTLNKEAKKSTDKVDDNSVDNKDLQHPIFFIHGIGIGLFMYMKFIYDLLIRTRKNTSIYLLELPYISMSFVDYIPSSQESLQVIDLIFAAHKIHKANFISHSYGTIVNAWIMKHRPNYLNKTILIDPICFALWDPHLIYNFLYNNDFDSSKKEGTKWGVTIKKLVKYFISSELFIAYTLTRNFIWYENIVFPNEIKTKTKVYLNKMDFIIDCNYIHEYLSNHKTNDNVENSDMLDIHHCENLTHGGFLYNSDLSQNILESIF